MGGIHWTHIMSPGLFHKGLPINKTENERATAQRGHGTDTRGSQAGHVRQPELGR